MVPWIDRRCFIRSAAFAAGAICAGASPLSAAPPPRRVYRGPNLILIRFGGGVRRRETIDPDHTFAPYFLHDLAKRGTLFSDMRIQTREKLNTSHGEGTLNILTGKYDRYEDVEGRFLGARFEAKVPTIFEYFRKAYDVPDHQALLINGEDRTDEEFYSFSNHHLFGVDYRCSVLSLYRFKCHLLRRQITSGTLAGNALRQKQEALAKLEALDTRSLNKHGQGQPIEDFWESWRRFYGEGGLVNPRGDELLTELAVRAMAELQPRIMMINYQDPDYVHWGNLNHYTRGIAIIDRGIRRLMDATNLDPFYRDNTLFAIVPDCGRDSNRLMDVPCQHHFNSRSSREVFALFTGPGVVRGAVVDKPVDQISVAATVGRLMGFDTPLAEAPVLQEAMA